MLQTELIALYKAMKMPEFDVSKIRELIEQAIQEFKKAVPGCDLAFNKLLQSLDTFTENFDSYYEQFNSAAKEPLVLMTSYIEDVQKQYEGIDNAECRKLIRQFKAIQGEFAKRLGSKLDNPVIKGLYD